MKKTPLFAFAFTLLLFGFVQLPQTTQPQGAAAGQATTPKQTKAVTTPKEHFGFNLGADYCLANYKQILAYFHKLEGQTDRLKVVHIGKTEEGRDQLMGIVTSPANHAKLEHYRNIARRMAQAQGITKEDAEKLAEEGKAVVWIDGGLHASEVLCAQVLTETMYQFVTANDKESLRILNDVIILFVHANPDGNELCADQYMNSSKTPENRKSGTLPRLYQKYIGHDNNRDFYANTQSETKNMNRVMYREWLPQIVYNHHQTGPAGSVLFCPPFRDPANYNCDPMAINGIDRVGSAMMERFLKEGKPGATVRSGAPYSTWFNGGLRTCSHFHNMIGLLTETIGSPTPMQIAFLPAKQLPKADYLAPIAPQTWHFRQSVDYSVTANKAVLDYASRNREHLLYNIWRMGMNSIERGNKDTWTITPKVVAAAQADGGAFKKGAAGSKDFERLFHKPEQRDPRGYILPSDQPDFLTATKFINMLTGTGITVHRATADFTVAGKKYPQGSYVVKAAQAFRPHVMDMFEPQDHPNDFAYEGAAPTKPYDSAGYTPAFTMGFKFDRILDAFDGPFEEIKDLVVAPPPAKVEKAEGAVGFFLSPKMNDSFRAVNLLLKAGEEVRRLQQPYIAQGVKHPAGTFFINRKPSTLPLLQKIATEVGTPFFGSPVAPEKEAVKLKPVRIGLWDTKQGGSMPSGWTRWLLERMDYNFKVIYNADLDAANLSDKYDVLLFIEGGTGGKGGGMGGKGGGGGGGLGDAALQNLRKFIESGGTVITVGGATGLGKDLGLPISNHLQGLTSEKYYVPSSVLRVKLDLNNPLTWGMEEYVDVMFGNSPTFKMGAGADKAGMSKLGWFDSKTPLRSGWAWGQQYLDGGVAMIDARVGKGRLAMFGPSILFRAQPHGSFKLLFNGIMQAGAGEQ
ncbi:MAG TPA: M14 metallopeptidase family protein [Gemmataceae bacterium]|nr:M14 metallopeptidase family protein [Gemmataceae bacterium]